MHSTLGRATLATCILAGALLVLTPASAHAYDAADKLGRGLSGMVAGVLELPGNMKEEIDDRGAEGAGIGFAKGLGMIVVRELVGVYEFVSAPIPAPDGYRPVLDPAYPWGYFTNDASA